MKIELRHFITSLQKRRLLLLAFLYIFIYISFSNIVGGKRSSHVEGSLCTKLSKRSDSATVVCGQASLSQDSPPLKAPLVRPHPFPNHIDDRIHMNKICGHWQRKYISLQKKMVKSRKKNETKGRFLVLSPCGEDASCLPLNSQFLSAASSLMLSVLFNRALKIEWGSLQMSEWLIPNAIDWRMDDELMLQKNLSGRSSTCDVDPDLTDSVELDFRGLKGVEDSLVLLECLENLTNVGVIFLRLNHGFTHWAVEKGGKWANRLQASGHRPPLASGCLLRFLFKAHKRLERRISSNLKKLRADPHSVSVCIHLQHGEHSGETELTDDYVEEHLVAARPLIECAQDLSSYWGGSASKRLWFLVTHSDVLQKRIHVPNGEVLVSVNTRQNSTASELEAAITAWYTFSKCTFFVLHDSGFAKSAAVFSLRPMSTFVFDKSNSGGQCLPDSPTQ